MTNKELRNDEGFYFEIRHSLFVIRLFKKIDLILLQIRETNSHFADCKNFLYE